MPHSPIPPTPTKSETHQIEGAILAGNQGVIGQRFRDLARKRLDTWEHRVLFLLARSDGYKQNDPARILQLAQDLRSANEAMIKFVEKYTGELFLPKAAAKEQEEVNFIDSQIIPLLTQHS